MSSRCVRCWWPSLPQVVVVVARYRSTSGFAQGGYSQSPSTPTLRKSHITVSIWSSRLGLQKPWLHDHGHYSIDLLGQSQQRRPYLIFVTRCATKQKRVSLLRKWGHWAFLSTRSTPFWSSMVMMESWKYESTPKRRNGAGVGPAPFVKRNGAGPASAPMRSVLSLVKCNQICTTIHSFSGQRVLGWCWSILKDNGADLTSLATRTNLSIRERTKSFRPLN